MKVLIVGGVAGGASAAARLRRLNEDFQIIMFEKGEHISFANCGLPYYIGDVIKEKEHLLVQTPQAMQKRFKIDVRVLNEVIDVDLEKKEVEVYDHKTKERYKESYDKLLLSPGASPFKPRGINGPNVFTLRNIPDTYAIKDYVDSKNVKRAVVVGGGFIGLEVAENLQERGVKTTVVQLGNQIIGPLDFEMAALVHSHLKEKGIELYLETEVVDIQHQDDYSEIQLSGDKKIKADMIVLGIGVRPEVELAKRAGLEIGQLGGIVVDEYLRTSNPDIYAVGDAVEVVDFINGNKTLIPLAGPANKQGRIAANNLSGLEEKYRGTQGTSVLKVFDMTVAFTGNNEKTLKRFAIPYQKSFTHSSSHAGYYPGAMPISLKIIFSPDNGKILGAQAVGYEGVEKRIDVIATAIRAGMTVSDLEQLELSYAPPYSSAKDPVNMAGYVANNILKGDCQVIHWHEIEKNKDYLIDVRTPQEFNLGTIEGAVNIPLDHLRDRLGEVPQDKEVVIFCQVGLRGYLAYRILVQKGYKNIKNLSGGYKTYSATIKKQSNPDLYDYDSLGDEKKKRIDNI